MYQLSFLRCRMCAYAHSPRLMVDLVPILHRQGSRQPAGSCAHALPISASGSWTPQMRLMCVLPIWSAGAAGTLHRATKTYSLFLFFWPFWSEKVSQGWLLAEKGPRLPRRAAGSAGGRVEQKKENQKTWRELAMTMFGGFDPASPFFGGKRER